MSVQRRAKLVREGDYVAEVDIDLIESEDAWAPYLSLRDARKLDDVRVALREGNLAAAQKIARVYRLTPLSNAS